MFAPFLFSSSSSALSLFFFCVEQTKSLDSYVIIPIGSPTFQMKRSILRKRKLRIDLLHFPGERSERAREGARDVLAHSQLFDHIYFVLI